MRCILKLLVVAPILALALTGCGPAVTEPKVVNVHEDPRIKRTDGPVTIKQDSNQAALARN